MDDHGSSGREDVDHMDSVGVENDDVDTRPSDGENEREPPPPSAPIIGLSKDAVEYKMDNEKRGVALVFYHKTFDHQRLPDRIGTEADRNKLHEMFVKLGFEVKWYDDLALSEIEKILLDVARQDHRNHDCLAVAVLTHGGKEGTLAARDHDYDVTKLLEPFFGDKCPGLLTKPKLFFIQACKGKEASVVVKDFVDGFPDDRPSVKSYRVPSHADILVWYATFEGQYASDNYEEVSCCIHCLCSAVEKRNRSVDLVSLLTDVNHEVKEMGPRNNGRVHVPCFTSSLTRFLYFR